MDELRREEDKALIKEALKEWLDEKFLAFSKWSFKGLAATVFVAVLVWLVNHGWIR
jgi:hypothetical protein